MITEIEKAEMEVALREYDTLRRYVSEILQKIHSDVRTGAINQNVADIVINGLSKSKTESNKGKEYNDWAQKANADESYGKAFNDIMRKLFV